MRAIAGRSHTERRGRDNELGAPRAAALSLSSRLPSPFPPKTHDSQLGASGRTRDGPLFHPTLQWEVSKAVVARALDPPCRAGRWESSIGATLHRPTVLTILPSAGSWLLSSPSVRQTPLLQIEMPSRKASRGAGVAVYLSCAFFDELPTTERRGASCEPVWASFSRFRIVPFLFFPSPPTQRADHVGAACAITPVW